jgi:hypothetical protein
VWLAILYLIKGGTAAEAARHIPFSLTPPHKDTSNLSPDIMCLGVS